MFRLVSLKYAVLGLCLFTTQSRADELKLVMGAPPTIAMVYIYVADQVGFLKEEGVTVKIDHAQNGAVATQIVAGGQGDVADVTMEPYIAGYEKGMRGKFITGLENQNVYFVAVPADSPIKSAADFAGKKIGVLNVGSQAILYVNSMARAAKIDPASITYLPVGFGDTAGAALRTKQVDAVALHKIALAGLVRAGFGFKYIFHPVVADTGNSGYFVSDKVLAAKRKDLVGLIRALIKSEIFVRTNPEAGLKIFWQKHPAAKPPGDDKEALRLGVLEMSFSPSTGGAAKPGRVSNFDNAQVDRLIQILRAEGFVTADMKSQQIVDTDLYSQAAAGVNEGRVVEFAKNWKP